MEGVRVCGGKDLRKSYLLNLEWKRVGVTESEWTSKWAHNGDNLSDESYPGSSGIKAKKWICLLNCNWHRRADTKGSDVPSLRSMFVVEERMRCSGCGWRQEGHPATKALHQLPLMYFLSSLIPSLPSFPLVGWCVVRESMRKLASPGSPYLLQTLVFNQ